MGCHQSPPRPSTVARLNQPRRSNLHPRHHQVIVNQWLSIKYQIHQPTPSHVWPSPSALHQALSNNTASQSLTDVEEQIDLLQTLSAIHFRKTSMEPPAQQQIEADQAILLEEARQYLFQMSQTVKCFDGFCDDLQTAINELSQYDVTRYLDVTLKCDYLKDCMMVATNQSAMFLDREQGRAGPTRSHIRMMMRQLYELRYHRNRIAGIYLRWMVCGDVKPWELEASLHLHLSILHGDVQRILITTTRELQAGEDQAAGHSSDASQPAAQQG